MTNPKIFDELHDAYIIAVEVDHLSKVVSLRLTGCGNTDRLY
jgi:hypothetical protein